MLYTLKQQVVMRGMVLKLSARHMQIYVQSSRPLFRFISNSITNLADVSHSVPLHDATPHGITRADLSEKENTDVSS